MEDLWRNWRSVRYVKKVWVWKWPNKAPRTMEGGNWKIYGVDWDRNGDFPWEEQTFAIKSLNKPISKIPLQFFPISAAPLCHVCSGWVIARQFRAQLPSTEPLPWAGWRLRNTELIITFPYKFPQGLIIHNTMQSRLLWKGLLGLNPVWPLHPSSHTHCSTPCVPPSNSTSPTWMLFVYYLSHHLWVLIFLDNWGQDNKSTVCIRVDVITEIMSILTDNS